MIQLKPISVLTEADVKVMSLERLSHYQHKATSRVEMAKSKVKKAVPGAQEDLRFVENILTLIENEIERKQNRIRPNITRGCGNTACGSCGDCKVC